MRRRFADRPRRDGRTRRTLAAIRRVVLILMLGAVGTAGAAGASTLSQIRERGTLRCGIGEGTTPGLNERVVSGELHGFFPDLCRGLARSLLGDDRPPELVSIAIRLAVEALVGGDIDVYIASLTGTLGRDTGSGARFVAPLIYYEGQGFLRRRSDAQALPLDGPLRVCVVGIVTSAANLADFIQATGKP